MFAYLPNFFEVIDCLLTQNCSNAIVMQSIIAIPRRGSLVHYQIKG